MLNLTELLDPTVSATVAHLHVNFTFPSVVLEHSSLIVGITCESGSLSISLASQEASQQALSSWSAPSVVLVTHSTDCGNSRAGQRIYYLVESVKLAQNTVTVSGHPIDLDQALVDVEVIWGAYSPSGSPVASSSVSAGPLGSSTASPTSGAPLNSFAASSTSSASTIESGSPCGTPPSSTMSGIPFAPCGPDFDQTLDDALGYYNVDDEHFPASFAAMAPGASYDSSIDTTGNSPKRSLNLLVKRWSY